MKNFYDPEPLVVTCHCPRCGVLGNHVEVGMDKIICKWCGETSDIPKEVEEAEASLDPEVFDDT